MKMPHPHEPAARPDDDRELGEISVETDDVIEPEADVFDPRDQMMEPSDQLNRPSAELIETEDEVTPCPAAPAPAP